MPWRTEEGRSSVIVGRVLVLSLISADMRRTHTWAPVSVAMSRMISADRSLLAYTTPSARTSLPSASVLFISTVLRTNTGFSYSTQTGWKKMATKALFRTFCDQKCRTFQSRECEYHRAEWRWAQLHFLPSKTLRGGCHWIPGMKKWNQTSIKTHQGKKGYCVIIKPVWRLLWKLPKWQQLHHSPFSSLALWSEDLKKKKL